VYFDFQCVSELSNLENFRPTSIANVNEYSVIAGTRVGNLDFLEIYKRDIHFCQNEVCN